MSLYDDEVDNKGVAGWSSGIKMLQSHMQLRKATGHHLQRKGQAALAQQQQQQLIAPVLDLNSRSKDRISAEDMPPIPLYVARGAASLLGGEWFLKDEYDPLYPNEYDRLVKQLRRENSRRAEKRSTSDNSNSAHSNGSNAVSTPSGGTGDTPSSETDGSSSSAAKQSRASAMIAPPPSLTTSSSNDSPTSDSPPPPTPSSVPHQLGAVSAVASNMGCSSVAAKIMAKMGFKAGQGLGKSEQGISSALAVEKTSHRGGKIVDMISPFAAPTGQASSSASTEMPPPPPPPIGGAQFAVPASGALSPQATDGNQGDGNMGPPPAPEPAPQNEEQNITEILRNPTKVVLLRNMVGPGEVDEDLEPEVKEECGRYGEVVRCMIYELPGPGINPEEAVRIFVEFKNISHAVKAVVDLNGRFFGGRVVRAGFYEQDKFNRLELI